jgi:hypothetical protein
MIRTSFCGVVWVLFALVAFTATADAKEKSRKQGDCACGKTQAAATSEEQAELLTSTNSVLQTSTTNSQICICLFFKYAEYCIDPACSERVKLYYGMYCAEGSGGTISYESTEEKATGGWSCSGPGDCGHPNCFQEGITLGQAVQTPQRAPGDGRVTYAVLAQGKRDRSKQTERVRERPRPFRLQRGVANTRVKKIGKDDDLPLAPIWQNPGSEIKHRSRFVGDPIFADLMLSGDRTVHVKLWLLELQRKERGEPWKHLAYVGLGQEYAFFEATAPEDRIQVEEGRVEYLGDARSTNALLVTVGSVIYSVKLHDAVPTPGG